MNTILKAAVAAGLLAAVSAPASTPAEAQGFGYASYSARIRADGATVRGNGVQASARTGLGVYWIEFPRDVTNCFYTATPLGNAGGSISINNFPGNNARRRVSTFSRTGAKADMAFSVMVRCAP